jgi:pectate lyase
MGARTGLVRLSNDPASSDWTVDSPTWTKTHGLLDGSGLTYLSPKIISSSTFPSDRTVQVEARTVIPGYQNQCTSWIIGKYVDFFDKVFVLIHTAPAAGLVEISVYQGATHNTYFSSGSTGLSPGDWHTFKLAFSGNTVKAYVDGTLYVTATDPIIGSLGVSHVSLASWCDSESVFDQITISG